MATDPPADPNVLFVSIHDLGTQLGSYGHPTVQSPTIDALADRGTRFDRAYTQVPVCGASRASMLTGLYPAWERFQDYSTRVDEDAPGAVTLPQHFRANGYHAESLGTIFHHNDDTEARSWSRPSWAPSTSHSHTADPASEEYTSERGRGPIYERPDVPDETYADGQVAQRATERIRELGDRSEPFFLGVGFTRPHLPFYVPDRYWARYDRASLPLPDHTDPPENAPDGLTGSREFATYHLRGLTEGTEAFARTMRHGYFAAVSYVDALVGDVLDALAANGLAEDTIVVLWSDHGFGLGEHGFWGKHTLLDESVNVPLVVDVPWLSQQDSDALVESVDLFPTLSALAGLRAPPALQSQWDGTDVTPLLTGSATRPRDAAYARWKTAEYVVTSRYSYAEYRDYEEGDGQQVQDRLLFDRWTDPDETVNVADRAAYDADVTRLSDRLERFVSRAAEWEA
jgi:arylsulfatase A-like enzyme